MKFTDGYWQLRPGVTAHFPVHVHEVEVEPEALTVYGPTRRLNHRGDTLNLPLLTVRFSSPMPDVIRVQLYHHKGRRLKMPAFELQPQPAPDVLIADDPKAATLTSGRLTVRIEKAADWRIEFKDGERVITGSGWRGMGSISIGGQNYIHEQLNLAVGECVYGLGERFTPFVKNGQVRRPVERGRRHQQRTGLQKCALLSSPIAATACSSTTRSACRSRSLPRRSSACSSACRASTWSTS